MATTNFRIQTKKNPANIYLRFCNGRNMEIETAIGVYVNPIHWDSKNQKIRNLIEIKNRDEINSKLAKLKIHIIDEFNVDFMSGEIINKNWLQQKASTFFNRPKGEEKKQNLDKNIYLTSFADWWLEEIAPTRKVNSNSCMAITTINHYKILNEIVKKFEGNKKIILKKLDSSILNSFSEYLTNQRYSKITASRMIGRLKFFCERAEEENIEVNKNYKQRVFIADETEEYKHPYLNEFEINKIFKYDFSQDDTLDNVRDNFIIGLWTGLRVSDFLKRLDVSNINDGFIEIKTEKTNTLVSLPIHKQVAQILNKRGGFLPSKISEQKFNNHIKTICLLCDIDEKMIGGIVKVDSKTKEKRKVIGLYEKYLLVTSHICRRSFATNLFGKIQNSDLMKLGGWASETMMLHYIKSTNKESAEKLKVLWDNQ
ncbi:tyrosine-type recombinase/integrase [Flavobacterium psychrophilum]|uniref:Phage integrase SAM-like domain-containing protein n=1 Tax=Flavobacterium psychrophilum TaxID=96345 RepID=A0A7U2R927_FLAPS|nr:phage integrase SAM-like domain-containing protein [Flavobacterium psychrophilum]QRE03558.1 phage integrase SAM-like domain-containing protein [Flavobacterium psychrophilum]